MSIFSQIKKALSLVAVGVFGALLLGTNLHAQMPNDASGKASNVVAVVELFTSQGCSSCPPADKLLKHYVDRSDVIAVSVPINYWDYLGWKDTYASARNTERQRKYAESRGDGAVYTPQLVVNGQKHLVGFDRRGIDKAIAIAALNRPTFPVPLTATIKEDVIEVDIGDVPNGTEAKSATVWLGMVQKMGKVSIQRGENSGRKLTYYNVVREFSPIGMWEGEAKKIRIPMNAVEESEHSSCVVLLQTNGTGPIIGATWID